MSQEIPYNVLAQFEDAVSDSELVDLPHPAPSPSPHPDDPPFSMSPDLDLPTFHSRPRTVSRDGSGPMQCPTPDLQSAQGAHRDNVRRLERSAERLSLTSDIGEAIRQLREEQKLSDSRRSSILNPDGEESRDRAALHRQLSYGHGSYVSNSIVSTNSIARSGGFSPAGYYASPRGSMRSSRRNSVLARSLSGSRLEEVAEPQQEGKPLDSPMSTRFAPIHTSFRGQNGGSPLSSPTSSRLAPLLAHAEGQEMNEINTEGVPLDLVSREAPTSIDPPPYVAESRGRSSSNGQLKIVDDKARALGNTKVQENTSHEEDEEPEPRPSTDTARQVNSLWSDFDGVHTKNEIAAPVAEDDRSDDASDDERAALRQLTEGQPRERPQTIIQTQPSPGPPPGMVYYPAPVPMMLNLPKRLSKMPPNHLRDQRRSQMLGELPKASPPIEEGANDGTRQSGERNRASLDQKHRSTAGLPPQLRATMFFDYPAVNHEVEVKGGSAVETLDSILDASAFAPVSAFTDHPIVGQAGAGIYKPSARAAKTSSILPGQLRNRSSSGTLLTKRNSRATLLDDGKSRHSLLSVGNYFGKRKSREITELEHERVPEDADLGLLEASRQRDEQGEEDAEQEGFEPGDELMDPDNEDMPFGDQPTTLLAELQMRKKQQKSRTKTAATAYPDGMQSTLLELDAVAQVEAKARKKKRTLLAWEDPGLEEEGTAEGNEDVPLGMLYPTQKMRREFDERPRGLIAQRQMEDNEPLSHRRARLRGEDPRHLYSMQNAEAIQSEIAPQLVHIQDDDSEDDHPGETLGQRLRRLKATQIPPNPSRVSGDFTSEVLSQFGPPAANATPPIGSQTNAENRRDAEPEEETLGQRRRRLQAEAAAAAAQAKTPSPGPELLSVKKRSSMADLLAKHPTGASNVRAMSGMEYVPAPRTRNTSWAMQLNAQAGMPRRGVTAHGVGGSPHPMMIAGVGDSARKDMIDRWRMSVMN